MSETDFEHQRDLKPGQSHLSVSPGDQHHRPASDSGQASQDFAAALANSLPKSKMPSRPKLEVHDYVQGVLTGHLAMLSRTITLVESTSKRHQKIARQVLTELMPKTGNAVRVGITGVPGVGKSTLIDQLGLNLCQAGHRVAVLTIDPSSVMTGGSILGDKTRMARLVHEPNAFIRPSPAGATLGGVARKTRETMLVCEAAGYDVILVETVGVGQSEVVVSEMTDTFLALMLAGAGDELQGIKRGIIEMADVLAINKAEGDNAKPAHRAAMDLKHATHCMHKRHADWQTPVLTISGQKNLHLDQLWQAVLDHKACLEADGSLQKRRREQMLRWTWSLVEERLKALLHSKPNVQTLLKKLEAEVAEGVVPPTVAADQIMQTFESD